MKLRFAALITILSVAATAFAQRTMRVETKAAGSTTPSRGEVATEAAVARRALALRSSAQAARFQQVAVALNLSSRQKNGISSLVQDTRRQLAAITSNSSLSPEEQQAAEQNIKLGLAQKFVGMLTPEQKDELQALLLKKKQQQGGNANASGSSGASTPDIPSVDAPSGSDSSDAQDSSAQNSNSDSSQNGSTNSASSADASASNATSSGTTTTVSAAATTTTPASQVNSAKPAVAAGASTSAQTKSGRLSDAQLAAILNSFVQDGSDSASTKTSAAAAGSSS